MIDSASTMPPAQPRALTTQQPKWTIWHTLGTLLTLIATGIVGWFVPSRLVAWLVILLLLIVFVAIAANGVTGNWRGALIDNRNRISLSRFQMLLWTILILSAYLAATLANMKIIPNLTESINLFSVSVPSGLWILMGIATTSLVTAPLILSTKTSQTPDQQQKDNTLKLLANQHVDVSSDNVVDSGKIIAYATSDNARWADLFTGEEVGNAAQFDLSKIQMFYFTFILVLVYGIALATIFSGQEPAIKALPNIDTGILTLLGISHAGYLTGKAVPHSQNDNSAG
ncbi:MAG TPA: hypothetical protein VFB60_17310 [Ktedonobacteraceae bacterium]|nr:hypothetical protein [Ktedonobacteraceae bacterium]